jgi:4-amino-4-deoxy-L-arabinose transferase-like glycosyltransferase
MAGTPGTEPMTVSARLREGGRPLVALLLVALVVKLLVALAAEVNDPLAAHPTSDARYYLDRALGLAGRWDDPLADEAHHLPPLYPWVLRLTPGVLDGARAGVRVLQALAGTLMLACVYLLARRRLSRPASLLAAGLTLLYGPLTFYETRLLGDSLATAVLIGTLLAADELADRRGWLRAALLGALVALAALLRPQALVLIPALALWQLRSRLWPALLAASAVVLAPSAWHNLSASGDLILVSDNGGVNLWIANTGPMTGTFATYDESFGDIAEQAANARRLAERSTGRSLSSGEVSSWFTRQALVAIANEPAAFAQRVLLRARALLESFETDIAAFPSLQMRLIPPLMPLALPFGLLAALCFAALVLRPRCTPAPRAPLLMVAGMVVVTALLFFHYSRFRLPLVPLLALGAASGFDRLRAGGLGAGRLVTAAATLVAIVALSWLPAPHHPLTRANALVSVGSARLEVARPGDLTALEQANAEAALALQQQPGFVRAELLAARTDLMLGRFDDCHRHLESVLSRLPDHAPALVTRAWLAALPDPSNPHHDPEWARSIVARLRLRGDLDAGLAASLDELDRRLSP